MHVIIKYEIPSRCRVWMCEYVHVVCVVCMMCMMYVEVVKVSCVHVNMCMSSMCVCAYAKYNQVPHTYKQTNKQKGRQHSDFPGGHPPEYYPSLRLLNFAKRTGYGALSLRWPSTLSILYPSHTHLSSHIHAQNEWSTCTRPKRNRVH